jgi:AAA+ superfamily predicted ATPase
MYPFVNYCFFLFAFSSGIGKTWSVRTVCQLLHIPLLILDGMDIWHSVAGEGEQKMRDLFEKAKKIKNGCVVFIDEIVSSILK